MNDPVRWLRAARRALRRRSPLERGVPRASMAALALRARAQVRAFQIRRALPLLTTTYGRVDVAAGCTVYVHTDTLAIDVVTLDYVVRRELFPVDVRGRVVLDVGSHKGYFGAVSLADGARAVISFEPEPVNHGALVRASVAGRDGDWERRRCAVGATSGQVTLSVSSESWSHSVHAPASGTVLRTERVTMVGFAEVLADVAARYPGQPVVLKLNVEGAAGDCLLAVPPEALGVLEVLLVDLEANTPQPLGDILAHIERAGFELLAERELVYHFAKRSDP